MRGEGVYYRCTYTVKTAGYLVSAAAELTARMELCMNNFNRRLMLCRMHIHRHSTTVIAYRDGIIFINGQLDVFTESGQCLVHTVIHDFVYEMMQTLRSGTADVHTRSDTNRFQSVKYLNLLACIVAFLFFCAHSNLPFMIKTNKKSVIYITDLFYHIRVFYSRIPKSS